MSECDQDRHDRAVAAAMPQHGLWRLVVAPVIAALHFTVLYISSSVYCLRHEHAGLADLQVVMAALTVLAVAAIGGCAWTAWRRLQRVRHADSMRGRQARFLARITLYLANLSWVGVLFVAAPLAFLGTCE